MTDQEFTRESSSEKNAHFDTSRDQDKCKGATEEDQNHQGANTGMQGQLGHRDDDAELKDADHGLPG